VKVQLSKRKKMYTVWQKRTRLSLTSKCKDHLIDLNLYKTPFIWGFLFVQSLLSITLRLGI
jgi:hypothetical protein